MAGVMLRVHDREVRAEAFMALAFGVFATVGAVSGYWVGTTGIPHFSPLKDFFVGLVLPGSVAG
jgi:hypothetical protein